VYYIWDYGVPGLNPSSTILKQHRNSETGPFSALRSKGVGAHTPLLPLGRANFNHWLSSGPN
jgi:hypothetical protein